MARTQDLQAAKLFDVSEYVCVITGGATGIGLMAAQALAANGARVYITGRRKEALNKAVTSHHPGDQGGEIIACDTCDVRKKEDLDELVKQISSREKYINLLVTAAGVSGPKAEPDSDEASNLKAKLWDNESPEQWNETYNTDVTAVYFSVVAFLPLLQTASKCHGHLSASVIVISSMSGLIRHAQGHFSYNAAKAATAHLSKMMSAEFQKARIRVNSIAPGYFPSEMTTHGESGPDQKSELPAGKVQEKGHVPMQRAGTDEEMAQAILFLAKNAYVNGEVVAVDGGVLNVIAGR